MKKLIIVLLACLMVFGLMACEEGPQISLTMGSEEIKSMTPAEAEKAFREMGFTKIEYRNVETKDESITGTICYVEIGGWLSADSDFVEGDTFSSDSKISIFTYQYKAPEPLYYSSNDSETARNGNTGVFSYKDDGKEYDIYWIIDFDEGYVYYFTDGNGESFCDRLKIESGTLNDAVTITYHDGADVWSEKLHFKNANSPATLIMVDPNGFENEYFGTNLEQALELRDTKTIKDY